MPIYEPLSVESDAFVRPREEPPPQIHVEPSVVEMEDADAKEETSSTSLIHTNATKTTAFLSPEDPQPEDNTKPVASDHSKKFTSPRNRKLSPIPERSEPPRIPSPDDEGREEPGVTQSQLTPPNVQSENHQKLGNTISVKDLSLIFDDGTGRAGDDGCITSSNQGIFKDQGGAWAPKFLD